MVASMLHSSTLSAGSLAWLDQGLPTLNSRRARPAGRSGRVCAVLQPFNKREELERAPESQQSSNLMEGVLMASPHMSKPARDAFRDRAPADTPPAIGTAVSMDLGKKPKVAKMTAEKAKLLRQRLRETADFHDVWVHSSIASRLANDQAAH